MGIMRAPFGRFAGSGVGLLLMVLLTGGCREAAPPTFEEELEAITAAVEARLEGTAEGTTPDLATEFAALDALVRSRAGEEPENAATALRRKASFQLFYLEDTPAGEATLRELVSRFPDTAAAEKSERMLGALQIQAGLQPGAWFPDLTHATVAGETMSLRDLRGKVVLIDFWATWCPPCRVELPHVKAAYEEFHDKGFEVVGISLDSKVSTLTRFTTQRDMPWPQICDEQAWDSPLVRKYGVLSIPTTYLLDREGRIVATNLRGDDLATELAALLGVD